MIKRIVSMILIIGLTMIKTINISATASYNDDSSTSLCVEGHSYYWYHEENMGENAYDLKCSICEHDFGRGYKYSDGYYYIYDFGTGNEYNHIVFDANGTRIRTESCAISTWDIEPNLHYGYCKCHVIMCEEEEHSWDAGVITKQATIDENGTKTSTCTKCKTKKTQKIPKLKAPVYTKNKMVYKVTSSDKKNKTVSFVKTKKKSLSSLTIPNKIKLNGEVYKVTSIDKEAFKNCKKLKKVTIGKNVNTIGKKAFYNCPKLSKFVIQTKILTQKNVGIKAFSKISSKVQVDVPNNKIKLYKKILTKRGISKTAKLS